MWIAVGATLFAACGIAAARLVESPAQKAAATEAPPDTVLSAAVQMQTVNRTLVIRGTVASAQSVDVSRPVDGNVVTRIPQVAGSLAHPGDVVSEINGRPVFALHGSVPVYRDLSPGDTGPDVAQLRHALVELRLLPTDGSTYDASTARAVGKLYQLHGYGPPAPSVDASGASVTAASDAVRGATRALQLLLAAGPATTRTARLSLRFAQEDLQIARQRLKDITEKALPSLPANEVVFLPTFPARVVRAPSQLGVLTNDVVVELATGVPVIEAQVQPTDLPLIRAGEAVSVDAEVTGDTYQAKVFFVGPLALPGASSQTAGQDTGPTAKVVIKTTHPINAALLGQDVRLTVETASSQKAVLTVPESAISSGADGSVFVTVVVAGKLGRRVIVKPGLSGQGFVEIRDVAGKLKIGDTVAVGG